MAWEISAALAQSVPPYQLFSATSANVDSWSEEILTLPSGDELGFRRRRIISIDCRATASAATSQLSGTIFDYATYCFLSRLGKAVTPHVMTRIYRTAKGPGTDLEIAPIFQWLNPFLSPARGGDSLTVLIPGDANATPTQDWEINVMMGKELKG